VGKRGRFPAPPSRPRPQSSNLFQQAVDHLNAGRVMDAENAVRLLLVARPKDGDALNLMGVINMQRGNFAAAISALKRAAAAQSRNAGVHFNLGNAYLRANQPDAALAAYQTATRLKPGYADAEALKGDALRRLGRWPDAARAYQSALGTKKDHFVALNGLGLCLLREGDATRAVEMLSAALDRLPARDKAGRAGVMANLASALLKSGDGAKGLAMLTEAVALQPENEEILQLLAQSLQHVRAVPEGDVFADVLLRLLQRDDVNPRTLSSAAVASLKAQPNVWTVLQRLGQSSESGAVDDESLPILGTDPLLTTMLRRTPIPDTEIELALTNLRRWLLLSAAGAQELEPYLPLICALAQQCFLNEYIYSVTADEEAALASLLEATPRWPALALVACYRPLGGIEDVRGRLAEAPPSMAALINQQIDEPAQERELAESVETLTAVTDAVSKAVRAQYEENPYPRWVGFSARTPRPFRAAIQASLPHLDADRLPLTDTPRALVAGCGTGLETMRVASAYQTASILAVDLSRASLAYGMRKLREYGIEGIEHRQADILGLGDLDRRFDLIHSFGVVHHMAEPQRGLEILTGLLEGGGFLFVGLYSVIARKPVSRVRALIAARGVAADPTGIRGLRRDIMLGAAEPEFGILASPASDFWTMSDCRDLMFHVEEHEFTLLQIEEMFDAVGLEFLGLEIAHAPDLVRFRQENPDPGAAMSFEAWHRFEEANPQTFGGTYQLWARKPA
jgi:tetratricopeptide (TPR) repeat protein/SAM-dependent methyltransferase